MIDFEYELGLAVKAFWETRARQKQKQESQGKKDAGSRGTATGGKHADGFIALIAAICRDAGLASLEIAVDKKGPRTLPGFFRPTKEWDIVVRTGSDLVAVVEVKSQSGSFGNNFNNRVEEALGNSTDLLTAYREGLFKPSAKPWLGYLFMLEEDSSSIRPKKRIDLKPYPVDEAFQGKSYAQLYEMCCLRLVRERLYDSACFFTSNKIDGLSGKYSQPNPELSIRSFAISLYARASVIASSSDASSAVGQYRFGEVSKELEAAENGTDLHG